jgi:molecular chaperone HscA
MLLESITHAKDDIATRALLEARTEGEQLLETTEKFIQKNAQHLSSDEMLATADAMQALQLALTMDGKDLIHTKIEELNNISRPYAERVMDTAISFALKNTKI